MTAQTDLNGSYSGSAIATGATGTLTLAGQSPGGTTLTGSLSWSTVGGTKTANLDGIWLADPNDASALYFALTGTSTNGVGTISVTGYTESVQLNVTIAWALALPGAAHDGHSEPAVFTPTT
ncbi:MAG: hypothetical protein ACFE0R_12165 [Salinarimonas sp.]